MFVTAMMAIMGNTITIIVAVIFMIMVMNFCTTIGFESTPSAKPIDQNIISNGILLQHRQRLRFQTCETIARYLTQDEDGPFQLDSPPKSEANVPQDKDGPFQLGSAEIPEALQKALVPVEASTDIYRREVVVTRVLTRGRIVNDGSDSGDGSNAKDGDDRDDATSLTWLMGDEDAVITTMMTVIL
eukprot:s2746_g1.t1